MPCWIRTIIETRCSKNTIRKRFGDNAFELDKFLFIGHSLPDDQIGKGQIIGKILEKYKVKRREVNVSVAKIDEQTNIIIKQKYAEPCCHFGQSTVI